MVAFFSSQVHDPLFYLMNILYFKNTECQDLPSYNTIKLSFLSFFPTIWHIILLFLFIYHWIKQSKSTWLQQDKTAQNLHKRCQLIKCPNNKIVCINIENKKWANTKSKHTKHHLPRIENKGVCKCKKNCWRPYFSKTK